MPAADGAGENASLPDGTEESKPEAREADESCDENEDAEERRPAEGCNTGGMRLPRCPPVEGAVDGAEEDVETPLTDETEELATGGAVTI